MKLETFIEKSRGSITPGWILAIVLALIVIGPILFTLAIWFHPIVYAVVYANPALWFWILIGLGAAVTVGVALDAEVGLYSGATVAGIGLLVLPLLMGVTGMGYGPSDVYTQEDIADRMESSIVEVDTLSEADSEHPRIQTRQTADTMADNSFTKSREKLGRSKTVVHNETLYWGYSIQPNGIGNSWFNMQPNGTYMVSMESYDRQTETVRSGLKYGQGENPFHNLAWKVRQEKYGADYRDAFLVPHEGETYYVLPYVTHDWRVGNPLDGRLPVPYSVPQFGGVLIVGPDGEVQDLSPEEAAEHPVTEGQPYYPYSLARQETRALNYRHGVWNKWFMGDHDDMIELAEVPGQNNQQPFTVPTENGLKYVVAVEPYGSGTGVNRVLEFDAQTGAVTGDGVREWKSEEQLIGPGKAPNWARNADERRDWNRYNVSEPIPTIIDGELWWMVHIVQGNGAGVDAVYFVNAHSPKDVVKFEEVSDTSHVDSIKSFIGGERNSGISDDPGSDRQVSGSSNGDVVVTVIENGTVVDEYTVDENTSIVIQQQSNESETE